MHGTAQLRREQPVVPGLQRDSGMTMVDLNVSNGSLFNLWNDTPVGIALGLHLRKKLKSSVPTNWAPLASVQIELTQGSTEG